MNTINDIDESRYTWSIIFNNSPYTILNNTSFDVSNTVYVNSLNSEILNTLSDISLNIVSVCDEETYKAFTKWINDIFETIPSKYDFETSGKLLEFNENGVLLQTYELINIYPKSITRGNLFRNKSLLDIKLNCTVIHQDEDYHTKKVNNNFVKTEFNKSIKDNTDKKENNTMDVDIVKPIVNVLDEIDSLYNKINNDDDLYDEDFIDALDSYKGLLKDNLVEIIRNNCK